MKKILNFTIIVFLVAILFSACRDPQQIHLSVIPEEGVYIAGTSIKTDSLKMISKMQYGVVQADNGDKTTPDSLYCKFFYATVSGDGFAVFEQVGADAVKWGLNGAWNEAGNGVYVADIQKDGDNFTVPADGEYFFLIDMAYQKAYLFVVGTLSIRDVNSTADAISVKFEGGNVDSAKWSVENATFTQGEKLISFYDNLSYPFTGRQGNIPTYLGGSIYAPEYAGDNINLLVDETKKYNFSLTHVFGQGFKVNTNLPPYDPRTSTWSLIGDAIVDWNTDTDFVFMPDLSDTANGIYKFQIPATDFVGSGNFKLRQDHDWANNWGYPTGDLYSDLTLTGETSNLSGTDDGFGGYNIHVTNDATYIVTFTFDVKQNHKYLDFKSAKK